MVKGIPVVISGPSGVGKGTVVNRLLNQAGIRLSISATTRNPRQGEEDGKHYFFVTEQQFKDKIESGEMLEYTCYNGNYYGTPKGYVIDCCNKGEDVVFEIETDGAMQVKEKFPEAVLIFITAPSEEEIKRRLVGRGTEDSETIKNRLEIAKKELALADKYDYIVVNDDPDRAASEILEIINNIKLK